jgi:hypothetical protein
MHTFALVSDLHRGAHAQSHRPSYNALSRVTRREVAAIGDVKSTCVTQGTDPEGDTSLLSRMRVLLSGMGKLSRSAFTL